MSAIAGDDYAMIQNDDKFWLNIEVDDIVKVDNLSFVSVVVLKKTVCLYYSGDNG